MDDDLDFDFEQTLQQTALQEPGPAAGPVSDDEIDFFLNIAMHLLSLNAALLGAHSLSLLLGVLQGTHGPPIIPPHANIGQSLGNYRKNFRQVCTESHHQC